MVDNHYRTLQIKRNASSEDIRRAYRKLAKKLHPDKNGGDKVFEARFKELLEAYVVLSDPAGRDRYDSEYDRFFYKTTRTSPPYSREVALWLTKWYCMLPGVAGMVVVIGLRMRGYVKTIKQELVIALMSAGAVSVVALWVSLIIKVFGEMPGEGGAF